MSLTWLSAGRQKSRILYLYCWLLLVEFCTNPDQAVSWPVPERNELKSGPLNGPLLIEPFPKDAQKLYKSWSGRFLTSSWTKWSKIRALEWARSVRSPPVRRTESVQILIGRFLASSWTKWTKIQHRSCSNSDLAISWPVPVTKINCTLAAKIWFFWDVTVSHLLLGSSCCLKHNKF